MIRFYQAVFFGLLLTINLHGQASVRFQLSPPQVEIDSFLFFAEAKVKMYLDYPQTIIRFTTNGQPVDSNSTIYQRPLRVSQSTNLRVKAYHPHLIASEEVGLELRQLPRAEKLMEIHSLPSPDQRYPGQGLQSLSDAKKGPVNFSKEPHSWLGWQVDTLVLFLEFEEALFLRQLSFSVLEHQPSWIFSPCKIIVSFEGTTVGSWEIGDAEQTSMVSAQFLEVPLQEQDYQKLKVTIIPAVLPPGHPGQGEVAWIFMDEIIPQIKR